MRESHCKLEHANIGVRDFDDSSSTTRTTSSKDSLPPATRRDSLRIHTRIGKESIFTTQTAWSGNSFNTFRTTRTNEMITRADAFRMTRNWLCLPDRQWIGVVT